MCGHLFGSVEIASEMVTFLGGIIFKQTKYLISKLFIRSVKHGAGPEVYIRSHSGQ